MDGQMNILHLPDCMIASIFEHLSYDEVSKKRLICKRIDAICQRILNRGFVKMIRLHGINMKKIKAKLPRRESERRNHPLARHSDILTCIETRISMLTMTYGKYIDAKLCCFIPGKVVDEVLRLLRLVQETTLQVRSHEILQELRDISSMAIEHFDEKISLALKKAFIETTKQRLPPTTSFTQILTDSVLVTEFNTSRPAGDTPGAQCNGRKECSAARRNRLIIVKMEKAITKATAKVNRLVHLQNKQVRQMRLYVNTVTEMKTQMADLRRRLDESEAKNREISANISQIKDTTGPMPQQTAPVRKSHIKPRMATIILKRRISGSTSHESDDVAEDSKKPRTE